MFNLERKSGDPVLSLCSWGISGQREAGKLISDTSRNCGSWLPQILPSCSSGLRRLKHWITSQTYLGISVLKIIYFTLLSSILVFIASLYPWLELPVGGRVPRHQVKLNYESRLTLIVLHSIANKQIILGGLRNVGTPPLNLFIQKRKTEKEEDEMGVANDMAVTASPNRLKRAQHKEHTRNHCPLKPHVLKCPETAGDIGLWPKRRNEKHFNGILLPASHHFLWVKLGEQVRAQAKHRHKPSMMTHQGNVSDGVSCRHPMHIRYAPLWSKNLMSGFLDVPTSPTQTIAWK